MARGEDRGDPSRGGAGNGPEGSPGDAEWLLSQLGADGATGAGDTADPGADAATHPWDAGSPAGPGVAPIRAAGPVQPAAPAPMAVPPADPRQRRKVALLLTALAVIAVLVLGALFFLGMRLASQPAAGPAAEATAEPTPTPTPTPTPSPTPSETPTPTPTPTEDPGTAAAGPVAPGVHAWDDLRGGECLDPYASPWEEEFTVVDCANPHPAQLVHRGGFPTDAPDYPGEQAIQPQLSLLCSAPTVIDTAAAAPYTDLQVQGAYPATAEQWDAGQRDIFCFVSRTSGEPLTGSIAVPQAPPVE